MPTVSATTNSGEQRLDASPENYYPKVVYKYLPFRRDRFISNLSLRFTQPSQLNDPFECIPIPTFKLLSTILATTLGPQSIYMDDYANERACRQYNASHVNSIDRGFGVLSMSGRSDSSLMWSHYAEDHTGFAIGFDPLHPFFQGSGTYSSPMGRLERVNYTKKRVRYDVELPTFQTFRDLFLDKDEDWKYEDEFRLIRDSMVMTIADTPTKSDPSKCIRVLHVPPESIREIHAGARASDEARRALFRLATELRVPMFVAALSGANFNMLALPARARVDVTVLRIEVLGPFRGLKPNTTFGRMDLQISVDGEDRGRYSVLLSSAQSFPSLGPVFSDPSGYDGPWDHPHFENRAFWHYQLATAGELGRSVDRPHTLTFDFKHEWRIFGRDLPGR